MREKICEREGKERRKRFERFRENKRKEERT